MSSTPRDPIRWHVKSWIFWTGSGHGLQVHHELNERAAGLFGVALQQWLTEHWGEGAQIADVVGVKPDTDLGWVNIVDEALLTRDPAELRDVINELAQEARRRAQESVELEQRIAEQFIAVLKGA